MKNSQIIQILDLPLSQSKEMIPPKTQEAHEVLSSVALITV